MKKIVVPIDFSPISINAFEYALRLADAFGCEIEVINMYSPIVSDYPYMPGNIINEIIEGKKDTAIINFIEYVKNQSEVINMLFNKVSVNIDMIPGVGTIDILEAIKKKRADLVVMGTKGASGLKETFFGSITGEVMESASCPVLAIPEEAKYRGINTIAVTTDFVDKDDRIINYLQTWASNFKANIKCIHVDLNHTHEYTKKMDSLASLFGESRNISFEVIDDTDVLKGISNFIDKNNVNILGMVIHQRNIIQELFNYSYTKKIVYHTKTPVLAMQAKLFE